MNGAAQSAHTHKHKHTQHYYNDKLPNERTAIPVKKHSFTLESTKCQ